MNENKNPNLPANAVRCTDVTVGMVLDEGTVVAVSWYGFRGIVEVEGVGRIRVNAAGTMRLA